MQPDGADRLRKRWGNKPCEHPSTEKIYDQGTDTGLYVCLTCGKIFPEQPDLKPRDPAT